MEIGTLMVDKNGIELKIGDYVKYTAWWNPSDTTIYFGQIINLLELDNIVSIKVRLSHDNINSNYSFAVYKVSDEEAMLCLLEN